MRCRSLTGEYYASVFAELFRPGNGCLRYFNVYGPRQDPGSQYSGVLSLFIKCILSGAAPTIFGDGEQSRDFTYVEDVVELNLKAARAPGVSGKVYNGGNGGRITLNQAWELLQKLEGRRFPPQYGQPRAGDVRDSQADTTAAVADLGPRAPVQLRRRPAADAGVVSREPNVTSATARRSSGWAGFAPNR